MCLQTQVRADLRLEIGHVDISHLDVVSGRFVDTIGRDETPIAKIHEDHDNDLSNDKRQMSSVQRQIGRLFGRSLDDNCRSTHRNRLLLGRWLDHLLGRIRCRFL